MIDISFLPMKKKKEEFVDVNKVIFFCISVVTLFDKRMVKARNSWFLFGCFSSRLS